MNVGIVTESAQFLFREYINLIFGTVFDRSLINNHINQAD
jgi:hypothetical protein